MALHPQFPSDPHVVLDPALRWIPGENGEQPSASQSGLPPLVPELRRAVKTWREANYEGATATSISLLNWWFGHAHYLPRYDGPAEEFRYFFAQREAIETIIYLHDFVGVKDKFDLLRFDSTQRVRAMDFDETWRRFVVKMATGSGKTKVLSLVLAWSFFSQAL